MNMVSSGMNMAHSDVTSAGWPLDLHVSMLPQSDHEMPEPSVFSSLSFSTRSSNSFQTDASESCTSSFYERKTITLGEMLGIKASNFTRRIARSITGSFRSTESSLQTSEEARKNRRRWKLLNCKCRSENDVVDSIICVEKNAYKNADYIQFLMNHPLIDRDWELGDLLESASCTAKPKPEQACKEDDEGACERIKADKNSYDEDKLVLWMLTPVR